MSGKNNKYRGFLLTEMIVAMSLLGLLLAGLALSLHGFAKFNRYQLVRQRCIAAAQAEIDSIAATGEPIPAEDFSRLWPKLSVSVKRSPGAGQWQGMERIDVTAKGKSFHKDVEIQLSRYILRNDPNSVSLEKDADTINVIASDSEAISGCRTAKSCERLPRRFAPRNDYEKIFDGPAAEGM